MQPRTTASNREQIYKGWLQTWFVHMRNPAKLWRELGPRGFLVVQTTMLGVICSALVHPFFTAWITVSIANGTFLSTDGGFFSVLVGGIGLAVFALGYLTGATIAYVSSRSVYGGNWLPAILFIMPLYWLLMSAAAWLAVWQFIRAPFHWDKTRHGISGSAPRLNRGRSRKR